METETAVRAIEELIHNYNKLVFHVIYGLTGHWEESEDLTQETFLQAFRGIDAARQASGPHFQAKPWLLKIAVNTVRMAQRRQRMLRFLSFADLQPRRDGDERAEKVPPVHEEIQQPGDLEATIAERDVVGRCLRQLPQGLCAPLLLSTVAGFSSGEIARMLDLKEATVRQRLVRARKRFQYLYAYECGEHMPQGEMAARPALSVPRSRDHRLHRPVALVSPAF
ncbi:MAG TPA: sigma-70 family RNA polymerase sigma factor [Ktedonobacteraceae bacterium]|nr:sigma-70 family RNA polymerase sigma factor [Ktedonobacteraceae bacterium]